MLYLLAIYSFGLWLCGLALIADVADTGKLNLGLLVLTFCPVLNSVLGLVLLMAFINRLFDTEIDLRRKK